MPQAVFETLARTVGIAAPASPVFDGSEPIMPSPFRVATAAAAALGLAGSAAAEIWRGRGGEAQQVAVDLRAAAGFTLPQYRLNGTLKTPQLAATAATGFYQSADRRWLYLHGGFAHLSRRTLELLNAHDTAASVMEAVAKWNGFALEDAMAFLGLTGAVVRSEDEWRLSVPGRLVTAPVTLTQVAPGPPLRLAEHARPLGGLRVLDLTRVIAGPVCTELLADHGAEVLSIAADRLASAGELELVHAGGKRRARLDLTEPAGAEALRRLAREAHVFVESCRPGALTSLGFSPASLAHLAPGMITVSISAFGQEGPWAARRGWEETVQAATGLAAEQGNFFAARHGGSLQPELLPGAVCDTVTGVLAAAGVMAALLRRMREGGSWQVKISLAATAGWLSSLGRIDAGAVPEGFAALTGLDQYRHSCETKDGWLEFLGPVVRMEKTPPIRGALPDGIVSPHWASAREEANAAEIKPAET